MILAQTAPTAKTAIRYNRSARNWQAINGTTVNFPAGSDGRRAAMLYALEHDHPVLFSHVADIARMHNNEPALVDRLIRAAALVAKGHVDRDNDIVTSQTMAGDSYTNTLAYEVTFSGIPGQWSCSCPDFANGGIDTDYGPMCKHSLAALIDYLTN